MKNVPRRVPITNPEKVLFPETGYTKQELAAYYKTVASYLLPFLKNRPLMLHRFPQGIGHKGFYQKDIGQGFPDWLERVEVPRENQEPIEQAVIRNQAALQFLINQNTVVLHPWLSTVKDLHKPDKIIFDFDPAEAGFKAAVKGALELRQLLTEKYNLPAFVMTSGSSGLHVSIPIKTGFAFEEVRPFAKAVADELVAIFPTEFTTETRIEDRQGKLFVDYLRNSYAQTAVAPYSVRALPTAPVAAPLFWEELETKELHARQYTIQNMPQRLKEVGNAWPDFRKQAKSLTQALKIAKAGK